MMKFEEFPNHQLVTLVVAILGGNINYIDREDIAIKVNELAPGRFNWKKYPEYIDLDAVGNALRDAKKEKNGNLLIGGNLEGWLLSPSGVIWVISIDLQGVDGQSTRFRKDSIMASQEAECARLRTTKAYKLYIENQIKQISIQDINHFARVNEYFQKKTRERRFVFIDNMVVGDELLSKLWEKLKEKYKEEMM